MLTLRPAWSYARTPPNLFQFATDDKDWQRWAFSVFAQDRVACPPEGLMTFEDCVVFQGRHLLQGSIPVPETIVDHPDADQLAARIVDLCERGDCVQWRADRRADVVVAKWGSGNYGHMLTDIAPKLLNLARARLGGVRLHLPDDSAIFVPLLRDLCARLAIDAEFRIASPDEVARFERVLFLTPVAKHARRKSEALRELRELMLGAYGGQGTRRLFVTRRPAEPRAIANQAEVASIFAGCGFEIVHPRHMSFADQVRLFSQASHVAGPVGAGMTNSLFAPVTAEILLIDPGLCAFYFWDAANLVGQPFHWHFAARPGHFEPERTRSAFHVDLDALLATLRGLGWTDGRRRLRGWLPNRMMPTTVRRWIR